MIISVDSKEFGCAFEAIRETSRAITQLYDLALAPSGLKAGQYTMLYMIDRAGEIAQCEFARQHSISVETLSRRFAVLRRKGLVRTRIGAHSQRIYSLTPEGKEAIERTRPYWQNAQGRLRQVLGDSEWWVFLNACGKTAIAAQRAEQLRTHNGDRAHAIDSPNAPGVERSAA
jgi:DNA-binding MarR family transcriptional regulator